MIIIITNIIVHFHFKINTLYWKTQIHFGYLSKSFIIPLNAYA